MNICVFDTETISVNKPYCYNIGYIIYDLEAETILCQKDFVCEQVWHNLPLFSTAYYAEKRPIYISAMKGKKCRLEKIGRITNEMRQDFKKFNVEIAFAYNSQFDEKVFTFNCDYFHIINPFDNILIKDIMPFVHKKLAFTSEYKTFCEKYQLFTESGNYSTTAETVTKYLRQDPDFIEDHTALSDSQIELEILLSLLDGKEEVTAEYKRYSSIPRKVPKTFTVNYNGRDYYYTGEKFRYSKDKFKVTIK